MSELRFNPFNNDWLIAGKTALETSQQCPLCDEKAKYQDDLLCKTNDHNHYAFSKKPSEPSNVDNAFFKVAPSYGVCEIFSHSKTHDSSMHEYTQQHIFNLIELWSLRSKKLSSDKKIKYISIFQQQQDQHPQSNLVAYSFVPKKIEIEIENTKQYNHQKGRCMFCDWLSYELQESTRIIFENHLFAVVLPFFSQTQAGVQIIPKRHSLWLHELGEPEKQSLAIALKGVAGMYHYFFNNMKTSESYSMIIKQAPVNIQDCSGYYHLHIDFSAIDNNEVQNQNLVYCNTSSPEEIAQKLILSYNEFLETQK